MQYSTILSFAAVASAVVVNKDETVRYYTTMEMGGMTMAMSMTTTVQDKFSSTLNEGVTMGGSESSTNNTTSSAATATLTSTLTTSAASTESSSSKGGASRNMVGSAALGAAAALLLL